MSRQERALLETEAEIASRRISMIDRWLAKDDVSPTCAIVAREQRAEYVAIVQDAARALERDRRKQPDTPLAVLIAMAGVECSCGEFGSSAIECDRHGYGNPEAMHAMSVADRRTA